MGRMGEKVEKQKNPKSDVGVAPSPINSSKSAAHAFLPTLGNCCCRMVFAAIYNKSKKTCDVEDGEARLTSWGLTITRRGSPCGFLTST